MQLEESSTDVLAADEGRHPLVLKRCRIYLPTELLQSDVDRWPYLKDINLPYIEAEVDLLIGSDVPMALEPQEVKRSDGGGPYAVQTLLGWTLNGPLGRPNSSNHTANRIQSHANLNLQFERFCEMEFNDSQFSTEKGMSQEDKRALTIMEESAELRDGHYEIALPWKVFPPELPNNKIVAEHRLGLLKKRLIKDPGLHQKYTHLWKICSREVMRRRFLMISVMVRPHGIYLTIVLPTHKNLTRSGLSLTVPRNSRTSR